MPSNFYSFKRSIEKWLARDWHWSDAEAKDWVKDHPEYMRAMWESAAPTDQVAEWIHFMGANSAKSI